MARWGRGFPVPRRLTVAAQQASGGATSGSATVTLTGAATIDLYYFNDANDGTNGASLSAATGNSADGSALFGAIGGIGGTIVYDNTHAIEGSLSYKATSDASGHQARGVWDNTQIQIGTPQYVSELLYLTAWPSNSVRVGLIATTGSATIMAVDIDSSGKIQLFDAVGHAAGSSTGAVPTGSAFRLEFALLVSSATVGQVEARLFTNPSGITPTETITSPANLNTAGTSGQILTSGTPTALTASYSYWFDQFRASPTNYPPPPPAFASGSASLTLTGSASVSLSFATTGSAAVTLTGTASDVLKFPVTASGALTLTGSATDVLKFPVTASGAVTLTGTATVGLSFTTTGSGAITLTGTASSILAASGAAALTLTGSANVVPKYPVTASGALALTGTATDVLAFAEVATGTLTLTASANIVLTFITLANGTLTLGGTGTQTLGYPATGAGALQLVAFAENTTLPDPLVTHGHSSVIVVFASTNSFKVHGTGKSSPVRSAYTTSHPVTDGSRKAVVHQ